MPANLRRPFMLGGLERVPPEYGFGANEVVADIHHNPALKQRWIEVAEEGDIDRVFIEWRSLLRRIAHAPALPDHPRWTSC